MRCSSHCTQGFSRSNCITTSNIQWLTQARFLIACPNSKKILIACPKVKKIFVCDHKFHTPPNSTSKAYPFSQLVEDLRRAFPSLGPRKKIFAPTLLHLKSSFPGSTSKTKRWSLRLTLRPPSLNWTKYTKDKISVGPK